MSRRTRRHAGRRDPAVTTALILAVATVLSTAAGPVIARATSTAPVPAVTGPAAGCAGAEPALTRPEQRH